MTERGARRAHIVARGSVVAVAVPSSACGTSVWGCSLLAYTPN